MTTTFPRRPPRLRHAFPEPDPAWAAMTREENQRAFDSEPGLADLERLLSGLGGHTALLFQWEPNVEKILRRGRYMPGGCSLFLPGRPSDCHGNAATLYVLSEGEVRIGSGYALSDDGLWCRHSWGVGKTDPRVARPTHFVTAYLPGSNPLGHTQNAGACGSCVAGVIPRPPIPPTLHPRSERRFAFESPGSPICGGSSHRCLKSDRGPFGYEASGAGFGCPGELVAAPGTLDVEAVESRGGEADGNVVGGGEGVPRMSSVVRSDRRRSRWPHSPRSRPRSGRVK